MFLKVIDDYYSDPESVRNFALSCKYESPFTGTWNGLHSTQNHPRSQETFFDIASRLPVKGIPNWKHIIQTATFWETCPSAGIFALLLKSQSDTIHFHHRTGQWAGVIYLSHIEKETLGVNFYRHKSSKLLTYVDGSKEQIEEARNDSSDFSKWEVVKSVDMKFNRMVIFDGRFFHAASNGFGLDQKKGRLTQLFSIDFI